MPRRSKQLLTLPGPFLQLSSSSDFLPVLRKVIQSRNVSVKYGQMEVSVQDAADQLRRQVEDLQNQVRALQDGREPPLLEPAKNKMLPLQAKAELPAPVRTILWVDDEPKNNAYEIVKFQDDGWQVMTATSTDEALQLLSGRSALPTVIISDMARREGLTYKRSAGLDLVREVRAKGIETPIYIYASSSVDAYRPTVEQSGEFGLRQ